MSLANYLRPVVVASLGDGVVAAARRLRDDRVGCLVVTREGRPIGILTDRDLALRVVAEGRNPGATRIGIVVGIVTADDLLIDLGRELAAVGDAIAEPADAEDSR